MVGFHVDGGVAPEIGEDFGFGSPRQAYGEVGQFGPVHKPHFLLTLSYRRAEFGSREAHNPVLLHCTTALFVMQMMHGPPDKNGLSHCIPNKIYVFQLVRYFGFGLRVLQI
jgi:hypothetical protein